MPERADAKRLFPEDDKVICLMNAFLLSALPSWAMLLCCYSFD